MRRRRRLGDLITIPRWKHHLGHAGAATAVAFVALVFGASLLLATALGTVAWPVLHEGLQALATGPKWRDHITDFVQHQPLWVVYFLYTGELLVAGAVAAAIALLYRVTLPWSRP